MTRYQYFKAAHRNKELFPSFRKLTAWDYSKIVCADQSDSELTWGRQVINEFRPDLRDGEKVVDMVGLVWRRNSPVPYTGMQTMLQGGGKCGPRSTFGVFINRAWGIPAIGVAQPAHACVAWRATDGVWQVGYGRGWAASRLDGLTGPDFVEGSEARSRVAQFSPIEHLRWAASAIASKERASAVMAIAQKIAQEKPASKIDLTASLKPEEANADPGVEAATSGPSKEKNAAAVTAKPVEPVKAGPVKAVNGVLRVEAAAFAETDGQAMFSTQKGVMPMASPSGGKQVYFAQQQKSCWADYAIDVPAKGTYEIVMRVAAINDGQMLEVGSDAYNATALPMSHGLWTTTKPVDVKLDQGIQKVRVAVLPDERGIALRWLELRPKDMKE